jgi:hypothetical protein
LEISAAYRGHGNFHGNDVAVLADEIPFKAQRASGFQLLEPFSKYVALFRQIGVGDGRANQLVLRNSGQLCAGAVSQNADAIRVNDVDRVRRNLDQVPILLFAVAQSFFCAFALGYIPQCAKGRQKFSRV